MGPSPTDAPVSSSRHDVTAWLAGKTRLTHREAELVRFEVDSEVSACGGRVPHDRSAIRRKVRVGVLPIIGFWAWLRIAWQVYRAIDWLLDLYTRETDEPQGCDWRPEAATPSDTSERLDP